MKTSFYYEECKTERYGELYMDYMLERYRELGFPYPFADAFGFLSAPLLVNGAAFLCFNEKDEIAGTFSYVRGTGEKGYRDTDVAQIQALLLSKEHREGVMLGGAFLHFMEHVGEHREPIRQFRYWVPSNLGLGRLCAKLGQLESSWSTEHGLIDEYRGEAELWHTYANKLRKRYPSQGK